MHHIVQLNCLFFQAILETGNGRRSLTSSLDSELELSSRPHLRETTPVNEGDTLTQLEQDMDG